MGDFNQLAALMDDITSILGKLTETQRSVAKAVRDDDLQALNECMKQQQTLSLSLRGLDQKRMRVQKDLQIENVKLADLPQHVPEGELRMAIRSAAERLQNGYRLMQSASEVARTSVECSLHEVEKSISKMGFDPKQMQNTVLSDGTTHADFRA